MPFMQNFNFFVSYAQECFQILRKNAASLLGVLNLMQDAGIPDMSNDPPKAIKEVALNLIEITKDKSF